MIFDRIYDESLAQASYLIGCAASGEAMVVDPNRDIDQYLEAAEARGLRIAAVTETHIHADFLSGSRELAQRTGATLYLSALGGPGWEYAYAAEAGATLVRDGDSFRIGNISFDVLHTPGHTPEHIAFLVTDRAGATGPMGLLSGDFLFAGDVGRPDLLEKSVHVAGSAADSARTLFRSLARLQDYPDYLQVWPGHGAGSACGKGMSAVPQSTLGYERLFNWAFQEKDEEAFVRQVLAGQPEPPRYFAEMKRINRDGPRVLGGIHPPLRVPDDRLDGLIAGGAIVVDTRDGADFAAGHVPGTISIPFNRSFTTWAGWLLPYDRDIYLLVDSRRQEALTGAVRDLALIGLDRIAGYFGSGALEAWQEQGRTFETLAQIGPADLRQRPAGSFVVLDVRGETEWRGGHLPGAITVPLGYLTERLDAVPREGTVVLQCQSGGRSHIAASLLQARGYRNVANLLGGFAAWERNGYPVDFPEPEVAGRS